MKKRLRNYLIYSTLGSIALGGASHITAYQLQVQQLDISGLLMMYGVSFALIFLLFGVIETKDDYESDIAKGGFWKKDPVKKDD